MGLTNGKDGKNQKIVDKAQARVQQLEAQVQQLEDDLKKKNDELKEVQVKCNKLQRELQNVKADRDKVRTNLDTEQTSKAYGLPWSAVAATLCVALIYASLQLIVQPGPPVPSPRNTSVFNQHVYAQMQEARDERRNASRMKQNASLMMQNASLMMQKAKSESKDASDVMQNAIRASRNATVLMQDARKEAQEVRHNATRDARKEAQEVLHNATRDAQAKRLRASKKMQEAREAKAKTNAEQTSLPNMYLWVAVIEFLLIVVLAYCYFNSAEKPSEHRSHQDISEDLDANRPRYVPPPNPDEEKQDASEHPPGKRNEQAALSEIIVAGFAEDVAKKAISKWGAEDALAKLKAALSEMIVAGFAEDVAKETMSKWGAEDALTKLKAEKNEEEIHPQFEENEEEIHSQFSKLFRFNGIEWKESGKGEARLLKNPKTGKVRFMMRQETTMKVLANHLVVDSPPYCHLLPQNISGVTCWLWTAQDFADDEMKVERLALKFGTPEKADSFKVAFDKSKLGKKASAS